VTMNGDDSTRFPLDGDARSTASSTVRQRVT
jgi:hypothetical protein